MENVVALKELDFTQESVFLVENNKNNKIVNLKQLVKNGFIESPVEKRSLILIPSNISGSNLDNLAFLDSEKPVVDDLKFLKDPVLSIVAYPKRIIDHLRRDNISLSSFGRIMIFCFVSSEEENEKFINNLSFLLSKVSNKATEINYFTYYSKLPLFFSPDTTQIKWKDKSQEKQIYFNKKTDSLSPLKEKTVMDNKSRKRELNLSEERVKDLLEQTLNYSTPEDLDKAKLLIKQNVPFIRRKYFAAYLLCLLSSKRPMNGRNGKFNSNSNGISFYINLGEDDLTQDQLKDLITLTTGLSNSDILSLNYKKAYSFFEVSKVNSTDIIKKFNAKLFGEKKVKVNYAKRK